MVKDIKIEDFDYDLPEERIAKYPLAHRDDSKLLVYIDKTGRTPSEARFTDIADYLPDSGLMVFNNTKVVPARILFTKETGSVVEIFCLEPADPTDYQLCFAQTEKCCWKCLIGNIKRWKSGKLSITLEDGAVLSAELLERDSASTVQFTWTGGECFSKIIEMAGRIPIPPYLRRDTEAIDLERYQTYYAKTEGSVAAPTAGLHFDQAEFDAIDAKGLKRANLCLHVGAGTFLPVKTETIGNHLMHSEPFSVTKEFLELLRDSSEGHVIAVGTTSTRCLESLYFLGVHCIEKGSPKIVEQWEPYREEGYNYTLKDSIDALLRFMEKEKITSLVSRTRIIIVPGYKFHVIDYLVTNFHQPQSTLLLLISAFIGDSWRSNYKFAMDHGFRFLSYGDSSLLQIQKG